MDVLLAVRAGEAEVAAQALAHLVAVEHLDALDAGGAQPAGDEPRDRALARARQAGEPECEAVVVHVEGRNLTT